MQKKILIWTATLLLLVIAAAAQLPEFTKTADKVYIDEPGKAYVELWPHTCPRDNCQINGMIDTDSYNGDVIIVGAFDRNSVLPNNFKYRKKSVVQEERSRQCPNQLEQWGNKTPSIKEITCFQNETQPDNSTLFIELWKLPYDVLDVPGERIIWYEDVDVYTWEKPSITKLPTYNFNNKNLWYAALLEDVNSSEDFLFRFNLDVVGNQDAKYDIALYPSFYGLSKTGIQDALAAGNIFYIDPWVNASDGYKADFQNDIVTSDNVIITSATRVDHASEGTNNTIVSELKPCDEDSGLGASNNCTHSFDNITGSYWQHDIVGGWGTVDLLEEASVGEIFSYSEFGSTWQFTHESIESSSTGADASYVTRLSSSACTWTSNACTLTWTPATDRYWRVNMTGKKWALNNISLLGYFTRNGTLSSAQWNTDDNHDQFDVTYDCTGTCVLDVRIEGELFTDVANGSVLILATDPSDGNATGNWSAILVDGSTIENIHVNQSFNDTTVAPSLTTPTNDPSVVRTADSTTWNFTYSDADLHEGNITAYHYVNDSNVFNETFLNQANASLISTTLGNGNYSKNDIVKIVANATDSGSKNFSIEANTTVANTEPAITSANASISYTSQNLSSVINISATDGDSDPLTYVIHSTNFSNITIDSSTGEINLTANLSTTNIGSYNVTINVSDGDNVTQDSFNLSIVDDIAPVLSNGQTTPASLDPRELVLLEVDANESANTVDTVWVNVSRGDTLVANPTMTFDSGVTYQKLFSDTETSGTYTLIFMANDTEGNVRELDGTSFVVSGTGGGGSGGGGGGGGGGFLSVATTIVTDDSFTAKPKAFKGSLIFTLKDEVQKSYKIKTNRVLKTCDVTLNNEMFSCQFNNNTATVTFVASGVGEDFFPGFDSNVILTSTLDEVVEVPFQITVVSFGVSSKGAPVVFKILIFGVIGMAIFMLWPRNEAAFRVLRLGK